MNERHPMIPQEIPDNLRSAALLPPSCGENEAAWTLEDAVAVISALESTNIAVENAQGYGMLGGMLVPAQSSWALVPMSGETESARASRSRAGARAFIRSLTDADYVSLEFSYQDDAA